MRGVTSELGLPFFVTALVYTKNILRLLLLLKLFLKLAGVFYTKMLIVRVFEEVRPISGFGL